MLVYYSPFGIAFQQCAERMGAQVKHDSFDTCVIEIKRVDVVDFIEQLRHTL